MFNIKNIVIGSTLALSSLAVQAAGVGNHELIDETLAAQHGYNLQGLQWVNGSETRGLGFTLGSDFVDTRYATAEEVTALLAGADLNVIDQVIDSGGWAVTELKYGAVDPLSPGVRKCTADGSILWSTCALTKDHDFAIDQVQSWVPNESYAHSLLIVNPDYVKPKEAWEWDAYTEVSEADGAQLDMSGLTWMRFKTIAHMSSKEIKEALAWGGSLSDWRWATATEVGALLKSDHDNEFQNVFGGSSMMIPHTLFYGGVEVNAAECSPLAEDIERQSLDTSCSLTLHMGDVSGFYHTLYTSIDFRNFLFLGSQNSQSQQYAVALVRK
ncbi:hypothetical protein [Thalassomonas actiniarum]|uniref:Uncharacterized protein n=1 Tax=Thalassomonas actiniarum TaxID=485447 RepID=A0AAE9YQ30_9GAMM|nr:hypothetical protein [Thalassomonas actiniarum]WDD98592.1 hypothetical protein SG35_025620 [Thalassomonas actiniarum]